MLRSVRGGERSRAALLFLTPATFGTFFALVCACSSFGDGAPPADAGSVGADARPGEEAAADGAAEGSPRYPELVRAHQPRAYWRFEGGEGAGTTFPDEMGTSPANYRPVSCPHVAGIVIDSSKAIDTAAGCAIVAPANTLDFENRTPFTLEAWIRIGAGAGAQARPVLWKQDDTSHVSLSVADGSLFFRRGAAAGSPLSISAEVSEATNYHVAATYDGDRLRLYLDGVLAGEASSTDQLLAGTGAALNIGWDGLSAVFSGTIDEVAIYPRALSPPEIASHTSTGTIPRPSQNGDR